MRTTVNLDEDVYQIASLYAGARGIALGAALGELVRKGQAALNSAPLELRRSSGGFPLFSRRERIIPSAQVKEILEDGAR